MDGGWQTGTHWNSREHQTWSATSYLRGLYYGVFGLQFERDGLRFAPHLPPDWSGVSLTHLPYRAGSLGLTLTGAGSKITKIVLDGQPVADDLIPATHLQGHHQLDLTLAL